jgi:hypothetical protein
MLPSFASLVSNANVDQGVDKYRNLDSFEMAICTNELTRYY